MLVLITILYAADTSDTVAACFAANIITFKPAIFTESCTLARGFIALLLIFAADITAVVLACKYALILLTNAIANTKRIADFRTFDTTGFCTGFILFATCAART